MSRLINLIVVHCSATPSGQWLGNKAPGQPGYRTAPAVIDAWHRERGFERQAAARAANRPALQSIGYHYVVDIDGEVFEGRAHDEVGAHVAGMNATSLGICMVGGAERDGRYTPLQWAALQTLTRRLSASLPLSLTRGNICGHRDLSPDLNKDGRVAPNEWLKTCPGFDVDAWLMRGMVPEQRNVFLAPGAPA